jgi:hypothetical protein
MNMMIKNMGKFDRVLRIAISLVFAMMILNDAVNGFQYYLLSIVAIVFVITAVWGTCPLYIPLKINTNKK